MRSMCMEAVDYASLPVDETPNSYAMTLWAIGSFIYALGLGTGGACIDDDMNSIIMKDKNDEDVDVMPVETYHKHGFTGVVG